MGNALVSRAPSSFATIGAVHAPLAKARHFMKTVLTRGVLALVLAALATSPAMAWKNSSFGIGLNWNCQSGGNSCLFGLFQNGQPPSPDCGIGGPGYVPGPGPAPCPNGGPYGISVTPDTASVQGVTQSYNRSAARPTGYQYPSVYGNYANYMYGYGYGR